ncbi:MAG: class I SAM-dependent methyltransferase [Verrucomicrobiota bacterium]|nr:class I SAM-dependent methyltransferase [Verrucomicrobiota bacterium]
MANSLPSDSSQSAAAARGGWLGSEQFDALRAASTNAHRLYSGREAWLERFAEDLLLSFRQEVARERVLADLTPWTASHRMPVRRVFGRLLPRHQEERVAPRLISGDPTLPLTNVVEENGMRFEVDFAAGYSAGLFIDQRANRAYVRRAGMRRVLNTFAYTCSFSVAAALGGAETLSIDLSKRSLERGRKNFSLNGIELSGHRFLADDVFEVLPRLARRGEKFDAILLDPPTFSRGNKGRKFQVENDFEDLLSAALEIAAPHARVLLSTNCARLNSRALEVIARYCLKATRRSATFHQEPPLPDIPPDAAARTLWLLLK